MTWLLTNATERSLGGKLLKLGRNRSRAGITVTTDDGGNETGDMGGRLHKPGAQ